MNVRSHLCSIVAFCLVVISLVVCSAISQAAVPAPPSGISVISGYQEASLTWTPVSGANEYIIYRSENIAGPYDFVGRTTVNCFASLSLDNGTTYYYVITALNGDGQSPYSSTVQATPITNALAAPRDIETRAGNGEVSITWRAVTSAVDYNVIRIAPDGQITVLTPAAPGLSFTDRNISNGVKYHYSVETMSTNPGAYSYPVAAEPSASLPKAPSSLTAVPGDTWMSLTWPSSTNTSHYVLYRSPGLGGPYSYRGSVTGNTFEDTGLTNDTPYYYTIAAINDNGGSAFSPEAEAIPLATLAPLAADITGSSMYAGAWLDWANVPHAVSYDVYRSGSSGFTPGPGTFIGTTNISTYTDNDPPLSNGTPYYYIVTPNNASIYKPSSNELEITPQSVPTNPEDPEDPDYQASHNLPAPSNIEIYPGNTQVTITWDPVPGAYSYYAQIKTGEDTYTSAVSTIADGRTSFTDTGLTNGMSYTFRVRANVYGKAGTLYTSDIHVEPSVTKPLAPGGLDGQAGNSQVSLRWDAVTGATGYRVYRRSSLSKWSPVSNDPIAGTYYNDTGLTNNITYYYVVAAVNSSGTGAWAVTEKSLTPVATNNLVPTNISGIPGNTQTTITWNPVEGATYYRIERADSPGGSSVKSDTVDDGKSSFTATGLTNGQEYYFRVRTSSPIASMFSEDIKVIPATALPLAPGTMSGSIGNGQVSLRWDAVTGATDYKVYRRTAHSQWQLVSPAPLSGAFFIDTGLTNGVKYYYIAAAINGEGIGAWAINESSVTPKDSYNIAPDIVSVIPGYTQATLTWNPVLGADAYSIRVAETPGGSPIASGFVGLGKTSYTATDLTNEQIYYFRVQANSPGSSSYSADISTTPSTSLPEAPSTTSAQEGNTQMSLSWSEVTGATGYNIYRRTRLTPTPAVRVGITTGTLFTETGLTNGEEYFYSVAAVNGTGEGAWSVSEARVTPSSNKLLAPTNLSGKPGNTQVTLTWDPVDGATEYYATLSTSAGGLAFVGVSARDGKTSATFSDLTNGQTYYARVRATAPLNSIEIDAVSVTPSDLLLLAPAPASLSCRAPGNTQATIDWDGVAGALSYNIYRRTLTSGWSLNPVGSSSSSLFNDTNLANSTTYYYVVAAVNGEGEGAWSLWDRFCTPSDTRPLAPINVKTASGNNLVALDWDHVAGATRYLVLRASEAGGSYGYGVYATSSSYQALNLQNGQTYYFVVLAENSANELSAYSQEVFAIPAYVSLDTDNDGIADAWEMNFFNSLLVCDGQSDFDLDKYTDLREYLNWMNGINDPSGSQFDPTVTNTPGGYGYEGIIPASPILKLMMPAILNGNRR